jgi:hypothetical protein
MLETNIAQKGASNGAGEFTIPYLNPGRYGLEASAAGFRPYRRAEFTLVVSQIQRLDPVPLGAGTITRAKNNRNLQVGLRMEF